MVEFVLSNMFFNRRLLRDRLVHYQATGSWIASTAQFRSDNARVVLPGEDAEAAAVSGSSEHGAGSVDAEFPSVCKQALRSIVSELSLVAYEMEGCVYDRERNPAAYADVLQHVLESPAWSTVMSAAAATGARNVIRARLCEKKLIVCQVLTSLNPCSVLYVRVQWRFWMNSA